MSATIPTSNNPAAAKPVMRVIVVDLETGGLDANVHGTTEIAALSCTINADYSVAQVASFQQLVKPVSELAYTPIALRIQGRTLEYLDKYGVPEAEAWQGFTEFMRGEVADKITSGKLYAHNAVFDHAFLAAMQNRCKQGGRAISPRCNFGCTKTLFHTCQSLGIYDDFLPSSLRSLCTQFGILLDSDAAHSALEDAQATAQVLARILRDTEAHFVAKAERQAKAFRDERVQVVTDALSCFKAPSAPFAELFAVSDWK